MKQSKNKPRGCSRVNYASTMHDNPRLYKYYWWVVAESDLPADFPTLFSIDQGGLLHSKWLEKSEGKKEVSRALGKFRSARTWYIKKQFERMCLHDALNYINELEANGESYVVANEQLPRLGSPFNPSHQKWSETEFAIEYDEDSDPAVFGHK